MRVPGVRIHIALFDNRIKGPGVYPFAGVYYNIYIQYVEGEEKKILFRTYNNRYNMSVKRFIHGGKNLYVVRVRVCIIVTPRACACIFLMRLRRCAGVWKTRSVVPGGLHSSRFPAYE